MHRRLDTRLAAILLPGVMRHTVFERQVATPIAPVTTKDRAGADVRELEMATQETDTLRGGGQQDGALALPFAKHTHLLIIGGEVQIGDLDG
jgi:hypothetical protein